jgi:nitroreductase
MDTLEAIKTRRSIRTFKPDPIDEGTLSVVLEAARWAPSWANTQCCRFIVVRDDTIKNELAATLNGNNPAANGIRTAPVVIVACAELGKAGFYKGSFVTNKGDWFMFDAGIAMQNLCLAAHAVGLGTVHVGNFDATKAEAILSVPAGYCVVEMTPLGYPNGEPRMTARKELTEIIFHNKFGAK